MELRFDEWYSYNKHVDDHGEVKISTWTGTDWSGWETLATPALSGNSSPWSPVKIPLTGYGGQTVRIGFHHFASDTNVSLGWYIDNVEIWGKPLRLVLKSPNGGEDLPTGSHFEIRWSGENSGEAVNLEYSVDDGENWIVIAQSIDNSGSYDWTVPDEKSNLCLVSVTNSANIDSSDTSDKVFSIHPPMKALYVDDDAPTGGSGSCWADALTYLQDALMVAEADRDFRYTILLAQGRYRPDRDSSNPAGTDNREATFLLTQGVAIAGGYVGFNEPDPDLRDPESYETILSGDLAGNDAQSLDVGLLLSDPSRADNSYHVVYCTKVDESTQLDGLIITGGNANAQSGGLLVYGGGGLICYSADPNVKNCVFVANSAKYGGAICSNSGNPWIIDCVLSDNFASLKGGAIYNTGGPILIRCDFFGNTAASFGGAIANNQGHPQVTNCLFARNWATKGAGIHNDHNSNPVIVNCTLSRNYASESGGGIYDIADSRTTLINNILWDNYDNGQVTPSQMISDSPVICYSSVQGDPLFADPDNDDFHLKSQAGRWNPSLGDWISDPNTTSTCIDKGNPLSDASLEPTPNGSRINLGRYGGTSEASKSHSDFNNDGYINFIDFATFAANWLYPSE